MRLRVLFLLVLAVALLLRARAAAEREAEAEPEPAVEAPAQAPALVAAPVAIEAPAPRRRRSVRRRLPVAALGVAQWAAAVAFGRASGGYLALYVASVCVWLASWLWTGIAWSEAEPAA